MRSTAVFAEHFEVCFEMNWSCCGGSYGLQTRSTVGSVISSSIGATNLLVFPRWRRRRNKLKASFPSRIAHRTFRLEVGDCKHGTIRDRVHGNGSRHSARNVVWFAGNPLCDLSFTSAFTSSE